MIRKRIVRALDICEDEAKLDYLFEESVGIHSIKVNSIYHRFGNDILVSLSNKYNIPLFYDLKIYDTPLTVEKTLLNIPKEVSYVTITYAHDNLTSLSKAFQIAKETGLFLFVVSALTSTNASKAVLEDIYKDMCNIISTLNSLYKVSMGIVIPADYIELAKNSELTTLTPGLVINDLQRKSYSDQTIVASLKDASAKGGDLFVLGRNFDNILLGQ